MILACHNLEKSFGDQVIVRHGSFHIEDHEKAALTGLNGAGKSTILKMITGELPADSGDIILAKGKQLGYLSQHPMTDSTRTVYEEMQTSKQYLIDMESQIRKIEAELQTLSGSDLEDKLASYHNLTSRFERENGYAYKSEITGVLKGLGFTEEDFDKPVASLSGGQRTRVSLGKLLLTKPDILLLDEPTNHLDEEMIIWLEDYLRNYRGVVLMVTHDRYFLDRVTNRILEVDDGKLYGYEAGYSGFLELKAQREEMELASERKRKSVLRMELEWAKRGCRARSTKQRARLERLEALKNGKAPEAVKNVDVAKISTRMGKKTIELHHISKGYGERTLIRDLDYIVLRDQRLGIIGPNGCGKSTLLKMLAGQITPDAGEIEIGETIRIGYFAQEVPDMDTGVRVIDYIKDFGEYVQTEEGKISASAMLERFLFTPEMQYTPVEKLSGGEKRRLYLLSVLMQGANVLLLDEPSNDLDIATVTILEDYLNSFEGIVVAVSHDRYFLDNVADRIFELDGNGGVTQYEGGYTDYLNARREQEKETAEPEKPKKSEEGSWKKPRQAKLKFTYKEQKEYEGIDEEIASLEEKLEKLDQDMMTYATNSMKLTELSQEKEKTEKELEEKMERWVYLNDLAERIAEQNA